MAHLLIVEDDARIARFIERGLAAEGQMIDVAPCGANGTERVRDRVHGLVILDRMLPDMDGIELCRQMRLGGIGAPVLFLSARAVLEDVVAGLRAGGDDYLAKPFAFDEFVARVEALLRRSDLHRHGPTLTVEDLTLDPVTRIVKRRERPINLTPREFALLRYLMENAGAVVSRAEILNNNRGYGFDPGTKVVDVCIRYLRRKVDDGDSRPLIHTVRGAGYLIRPQPDAADYGDG